MVNRKATAWFGLALAFIVVTLGGYKLWVQGDPEERESISSLEKVIRFSYTLSNQSAEPVNPFEFTSYAPVDIDSYQKVLFIESSREYSLKGHGTTSNIVFGMDRMPPYGNRIVNLTMGVQVLNGPKYEEIDQDSYLKSEAFIEVADPAILRVANKLVREASDLPKSTFQWVVNNIQDAGYIAQNKGAKYAIEEKRGDCTEYMYAFIALARANGIPARGVAGFVIEKDAAMVASSDYHNWAEFHNGEKWVLVDPYKGAFDEKYGNYVAFRFIGGEENGLDSARRFLAVDERVSVRL